MARRVPVRVLPGCRGRIPVGELRRIARHVLDAEGVSPTVELELVLADAATVRELNRLYRGRDEPTDVLSFEGLDDLSPLPLSASGKGDRGGEVDAIPFIEPPDKTPSLGEVIVCLPVAEAQSSARGHRVAGEIAHLIVHGLLHLLGCDHEEEADSAKMQSREDELLSELGYAGTYEHGH